MIEVVGILVSAGNRKHARAQDIGHAVGDKCWIARVGNQPGEALRDAHVALDSGEQHNATVRCQATTIESRDDFLPSDGWKAKRLSRSIGHGGCGSA
jgi:hypothetical protein